MRTIILVVMLLFLAVSCARPPGHVDESHDGRQYGIRLGPYISDTPFSPMNGIGIEVDSCQAVRIDVFNFEAIDMGSAIDTILCAGQYVVLPFKLRREIVLSSGSIDTVLVPLDNGIYFYRATMGAEKTVGKFYNFK
ncbi:MAG: hypothetical protein JSU65_01315 [Candidatus Zixiibacteriota bacterium]|nr:MAG: hypothetical protein JSU65_01315 [candidate division Zixibacteria bacterium]